MSDKEFNQKAYEKVEMVKRNPDKITVMVAEDQEAPTGRSLVLTVGSTPIAKILSEIDLSAMTPDFNQSDALAESYAEAARIDTRQTPEEFNGHNFAVTQILDRALTKMGLQTQAYKALPIYKKLYLEVLFPL